MLHSQPFSFKLISFALIKMSVDCISKLDAPAIKRVTDALGEDDSRRKHTIRTIREWLQKQPHLRHCEMGTNSELFILSNWLLIFHNFTEDRNILAFARGCKYSIEKTKRKLDLMLTMRSALPEFFSGCDPYRPEVQALLKVG